MQKEYKSYNGKTVIGLIEPVVLAGRNNKKKKVMAKIDTGATNSSIDITLASELNVGPIIETKLVKSAHGNSLRPIVALETELAGKKTKTKFNIADRNHMRYQVLIGQNILKDKFLIDPAKK